jgi:hypothetical protein
MSVRMGEEKPQAELFGTDGPSEDSERGTTSEHRVASIEWYAELQRQYWNAAFPHKRK